MAACLLLSSGYQAELTVYRVQFNKTLGGGVKLNALLVLTRNPLLVNLRGLPYGTPVIAGL